MLPDDGRVSKDTKTLIRKLLITNPKEWLDGPKESARLEIAALFLLLHGPMKSAVISKLVNSLVPSSRYIVLALDSK